MALYYTPEKGLAETYQTVEAAPFTPQPEFVRKDYKVVETLFGKLGILLCFEDATPKVAQKAVQSDAEFLVALSNPGFFTSTHLPYYHLLQDQLRAIESNRWIIRVSANGFSAVVNPHGQLTHQTQLSEEKIIFAEVGLPK